MSTWPIIFAAPGPGFGFAAGMETPLLSIRSNVPGILWPPISHGPAADLAAMLQQLELTQRMPPQELAAQQLRQLEELARHCEIHSPQFGRRLRKAGLTAKDLSTPGGLQKLPVLRRRDLQEEPDIFCTQVPASHLPVSVSSTSGSTGEPVKVRRTEISSFDWQALNIRDHFWHGRDFAKPQCAVRANVRAPAQFADWGPPVSLLFDTGPVLAIPITADIDRQIDWIAEFNPSYLLNYPSALAAITRRCAERGIKFPGLLQIRTIGETLTSALRTEIGAAFGVGVVDCYSSQEVGYIAFDCPDAPLYHVMAETLIVEVLDERGDACAEGETGRIVVTDLRNFAMPLIRYEIGDYAEVGPPCSCGRTLPTLKRIAGRERNLVRLPDGTQHWPLVGYARFRDIAPIRQYQIVQTALDAIEVRFAVDRALSTPEQDALAAIIAEELGYKFRMRFTFFSDRIPPSANGKFEEFISAPK